jgi:hypothetical protein
LIREEVTPYDPVIKKVHRPKLGLKNINDSNDNSGSTFSVPEYYTVPPVLGGHMAEKLT